MKFTDLLESDLQRLDEMAIASMSGAVDAFGQTYSYETSQEGKVFTTTVRNNQGKIGEIVFSNPDRLVYFNDERGSQVKIERMKGSKPSRLDGYYVPELINRVSTNSLF